MRIERYCSILVFVASMTAVRSVAADKVWPAYPLRGVNAILVARSGSIDPREGCLTEDAILKLSEWGVNLIRVPIEVEKGGPWDVGKDESMPPVPDDDPMLPYRKHIEGLRVALALAEKHGIYVIPTAGNVVGRHTGILQEPARQGGYQATLVALWRHVAVEFGQHPMLLGYDLLNEPGTPNERMYWETNAVPELIKAIRSIDQSTYVVIEPAPCRGLAYQPVTSDKKVVYSFHFYEPATFTHQGVKALAHLKGKYSYPGRIRSREHRLGVYWDREQMMKAMKPIRDFQVQCGVRIWIGEFSAIRWAPGSAKWIEDAISVFDEYGWDWTYHSYGGWNGWNPTFSADDEGNNNTDGGQETDRLQVLRKAWQKNRGTVGR